MSDVVIDNPILNLPFEEPTRHWRFADEGITDDIIDGRRRSSYFVPVPGARKSSQLAFDTEWTRDRIEENAFINRVRERVGAWRKGGWQGITASSRELLEFWTNPDRERRLFFCQVEALETLIYATEAASKFGDAWIENHLRDANRDANPELMRLGFKMATGSGKTVVMAMMIAWHSLNKAANPRDKRFSDSFLIVAPGITIRDRLRVLLPNDSNNYYRQLEIVPPQRVGDLGTAKIVIANFHRFKPREKTDSKGKPIAGKLAKAILSGGTSGAFTETPDQMVRRVTRGLGSKKNIIVINDEAHHCYRRRSDDLAEKVTLAGDDKREATEREEAARVWIGGLEAIKRKLGVKAVYDLSATPFFLRGSGYSEGTLFPWIVSDFSLIDAIEAGLVKIPRVPVADNAMDGELPRYRDLWRAVSDDLPKKGRKTDAISGQPQIPAELEGALRSLYANYEKHHKRWAEAVEKGLGSPTPPVYIVVCSNTNVSKLVFDWISGYDKTTDAGATVAVPGGLPLFSNVVDGQWSHRPNSILIDSLQLESGEAMSAAFKSVARREIEDFKAEYRERFPGRDADKLTDEDLLREVMNTVGKPGKLGEQVRCVVSVSMLTEGWDANTVTHILGVRAFGTQLLCEQVVGRGLRRISYEVDETGHFPPEYAEVYGVPFSFIPSAGSAKDPKPQPMPTRVRAMRDRAHLDITFPNVVGYRYRMSQGTLNVAFTAKQQMTLTTKMVPTQTEQAAIVGKSEMHSLDDLKTHRPQEIAFLLTKLVLEKYYRQQPPDDDEGEAGRATDVQAWMFPQVLRVARQWLSECVTCEDDTFPQLLMLSEPSRHAADKIYDGIVGSTAGEKTLLPILRPYEPDGSTSNLDFNTTKPVYRTREDKCPVEYVVADTKSWEQKMAQALEQIKEVVSYVKNDHLGFTIPYESAGDQRRYTPDFIARVRDGNGDDDLLNLVVEVSGEARPDKAIKISAARSMWIPAINHHGGYGRWELIEITNPWDAKSQIREHLEALRLVSA